jgi:hypothetical protein
MTFPLKGLVVLVVSINNCQKSSQLNITGETVACSVIFGVLENE